MKKSKIFKPLIIIVIVIIVVLAAAFLPFHLFGNDRAPAGQQAQPEVRDIGITYSLSADDTGYLRSSEEGVDRYTDQSDESGNTFFEVRFIRGETVASLAPSFLDSYIDFRDIEFAGISEVGETGLTGQFITATNEEATLEAYLIDEVDGTLAVVLSYTPDTKDAQLAQLQTLLDSLSLK